MNNEIKIIELKMKFLEEIEELKKEIFELKTTNIKLEFRLSKLELESQRKQEIKNGCIATSFIPKI